MLARSQLDQLRSGLSLDVSGRTPDYVLDEIAAVAEGSRGALLLLGCAHAGLRNTVQQVEAMTEKPLRVVVGGLHLTKAMNVTCARVRYSYVNEAWNSLQHLTARDAKLRIFWVIT